MTIYPLSQQGTDISSCSRLFRRGAWLILATMLSGCAWYAKQPWAPDGFNYTEAWNHRDMSLDQHWFGFTWNLKPERTR